MGLFGLFKKKQPFDEAAVLQELKDFAKVAIQLATPEIEETGSFLPFGAGLSTDRTLEQVVYHDASASVTSIDHRAHATIIQKLIQKKYKQPNCLLIMMAWDGIAHLPTGDIDAITVRVGHRPSNIHRMFTYPYKVVNKKLQLQDADNPVMQKV